MAYIRDMYGGSYIIEINGDRIRDMRTNTYYMINGNHLNKEGSGPIYRFSGNYICEAFGSYILEVRNGYIRHMFRSYQATIEGNYITSMNIQKKYEIVGRLSNTQLLAVVALLFANS